MLKEQRQAIKIKWSLRKKLIIFLMLATVLPFGTGILVTYFHTIKKNNTEAVTKNYELIQKGEEELSSYINDIALMSSVLYRYTPFMNVLSLGIDQDGRKYSEEVTKALAYLFNSRTEIEQMHLYINKGKNAYTNYHSRISGRGKSENVYNNHFYRRLRDNPEEYYVIEPPHEIYNYSGLSIIPDSEKSTVLTFHNKLRDIPSDDILGFFSIDINLSKIEGIVNRLYKEEAEELYIIDENGMIIYAYDHLKWGTKNEEKWYQAIKKQPINHSMEWEDKEFSGVIVYEDFKIQDKTWFIAKRIPFDILYKGARNTALMNVIIAVVSLIIVIIITMIVSVKMTAPIKILIENMKRVEKGEFVANFETLGNDEIGMLGNHFKSMIAKINQLIEREYKLEIENKASELKVLRSQINPHFLYNSFQSIGTLALKSNAAQVYSLLTALSSIMRYSMNMKEDIVPLSKEVKHVQSYLALQKQRFEEELTFSIDVEEKVGNVLVPKMILQPIVENCFKHAFDGTLKHAVISVQAYSYKNRLICIVSDNGKGVSSERLESITHLLFTKEKERRTTTNREFIGLKNIYDRLQIYYNNEAKLFICSEEKGGFVVTLNIPLAIDNKEVNQDEGTNS